MSEEKLEVPLSLEEDEKYSYLSKTVLNTLIEQGYTAAHINPALAGFSKEIISTLDLELVTGMIQTVALSTTSPSQTVARRQSLLLPQKNETNALLRRHRSSIAERRKDVPLVKPSESESEIDSNNKKSPAEPEQHAKLGRASTYSDRPSPVEELKFNELNKHKDKDKEKERSDWLFQNNHFLSNDNKVKIRYAHKVSE